MPVDLSKPHSDRRRVNRDAAAGIRQDGMHSREIEMKRNRGEISCAECRRLKIKCDKQIPCQSCQARCASLCPNGSLATGQGTRFVIAATEHLHRRIARMGDRIRQLEDALAVLQASHSTEPHPLLGESSIIADSGGLDEQLQESDDEGAGEVLKSLGTLSVSDHGLSRFFGSTGGSDLLLVCCTEDSTGSPSQKTESDSSGRSLLPPQLQRFSYSFPFTPMGPVKETTLLIRNCLPAWEQALSMAESYLENAAWIFRSVTRHQLINEMLPAIYGKQLAYPSEDYSGPHDLALLFSIFALGSVLDVNLPTAAAESEGEHYNQLALAALCLQPVFEKPSLVTVQTLHITSIYNAMLGSDISSGKTSMESTWSLVALAAHLALSVQTLTVLIDRDPARWETDPKIVQRRRMVFWDLFIADSWHALSNGRPPAFNRAYIDCKFPRDEDIPNTLEPGVFIFRFAFECTAEIVARTLTATSPRYTTIRELDRKIRDFNPPPQILEMIRASGDDPRSLPLSASMSVFMFSNIPDVMLLSLHRNFFVQALIEDPEDPIKGQYAPSFLATVRASKKILQRVEAQLQLQPVMTCRFWTIWTFTFSAAVVFAFIATRGPLSPLANDAMKELDRGCSLIKEAAKHNRRAAKAFDILDRMRDKAKKALMVARNAPPHPRADGAAWGVKQEELDDEFTVYAGRTKVFRSGGVSPSGIPPQAPMVPGPTHDEHAAHAQVHLPPGQSMIGEWLAGQEQYVGYDPHYVTSIELPPPTPHQPQHHQYGGYSPEQPQYTLEVVPPHNNIW
ncbi:hypothetical protein B0F90DRAFT_1640097 [Multifurca ochricompacta]|uniref:Zn(2)-C6 fungal-type domain-containing protein n=1 Tax=Multifurca ochricompacta TaxID=376703 RepID=A0AAD4LYI0_9AGAM|nr:hypothetical protein B0F90DRAFT_1640097 [Multifurca ochricompacta]